MRAVAAGGRWGTVPKVEWRAIRVPRLVESQ